MPTPIGFGLLKFEFIKPGKTIGYGTYSAISQH